jgi:hypothetical protein
MKSRAKRAISVVLGLAAGLAIAEGIFRARDGGAFPHLNVYVADAELGVRLQPGGEQRVAFGGNPVTRVRINAQGYRGEDWPAPGGDEVLVVGDSMAFGLGVEEGDTFAAKLGKETGARVANAGVPTYGPPEYEKVLTELLEKRKPKTVVYTLNLRNDAFEARRPNAERHRVWDGWAVRRENTPSEYASFPGRSWLFRDSHAVFALRQWLYFRNGGSAVSRGVPSEGDVRDLLDVSGKLEEARKQAREETDRRAAVREAEARYATLSATAADLHVKLLAYKTLKLSGATSSVYLASSAIPGDIVVPQQGEEGSPLGASVKYVREAVALRERLEKDLRERALAEAGSPDSKEILRSIEERDRLEKKLREAHAAPLQIVRASLPIIDVVLRAKALVERKGARFVLLALPLDVMVSRAEWKKYGEAQVDVAPARVLLDDLASAVRDAGGTVVDPTAELAAAEPGAYLDRDPHPTAKGHEAIAKALARGMHEPAKSSAPKGPLLALPEGRSRLPRPGDWPLVGGGYLVSGSDAAGCDTRRIREWVYVRCTQKRKGPTPAHVEVLSGGHGEAITLSNAGVVSLVAPIVRGDSFEARFSWMNDGATKNGAGATFARKLVIHWPADVVEPEAALVKDTDLGQPAPAADLARLCACYQETSGEKSCEKLLAAPRPECLATYGDRCAELLECATGWPARMPRCPEGQINAGAELWCFTPCAADGSCKEGTCTETQGAKLCVPAASVGAPASSAAPAPASSAPRQPFAAAELAPLGRAAVDAALKAADACRLVATDPGTWFDYISYDQCSWKAGEVDAYQAALKPLLAYADAHELPAAPRTFVDHARLFGEWLSLAARSESRGTVRLYQDLALAYNAQGPAQKVDADPPSIVKQYTEDFGVVFIDYIWKSYGRYKAHAARPRPFVWRTGAQGPFLAD